MSNITIICGPAASGKTRNTELLLQKFGHEVAIDEWTGTEPLPPDCLVLTQLNVTAINVHDAVNSDDGFSQLASLEGFLRAACKLVRHKNEKWWRNPHTGEPIQRNVGELLMLQVSELAEAAEGSPQYNIAIMEIVKSIARAMEGHRKTLMDDKLPQYPMITVELADAMIRIMDTAEGLNLDLAGAWRAKMEYNATRKDHTFEARTAPGGKAY